MNYPWSNFVGFAVAAVIFYWADTQLALALIAFFLVSVVGVFDLRFKEIQQRFDALERKMDKR